MKKQGDDIARLGGLLASVLFRVVRMAESGLCGNRDSDEKRFQKRAPNHTAKNSVRCTRTSLLKFLGDYIRRVIYSQ